MPALKRPRRLAPSLGALCALACSAPLALAAADAPLRSLALAPSQVGPGYTAQQVPVASGEPKLPCGHEPKGALTGVQTFARGYVKAGSPAVFNVIARYRSAAVLATVTAAQRRALKSCPAPEKVSITADSAVWIYPVVLTAKGLLSGSSAERDVFIDSSGGHTSRRTVFVIAQVAGAIESSVQAGGPNVTAARAAVLHAAQESAGNLR